MTPTLSDPYPRCPAGGGYSPLRSSCAVPCRNSSGTPYGGQSPTALACRHLSQSPFRTNTGFRVPAAPPRFELSEGSPYHVHLFDPRRSVECAQFRPECASLDTSAGNEKARTVAGFGDACRVSACRRLGVSLIPHSALRPGARVVMCSAMALPLNLSALQGAAG